MSSQAAQLAYRLARNPEPVCRYYLSNGRREGRYWIVGDVANAPGRSLYVRLSGPASGRRAAGKWTDAATGQHGDLLDLIALSCGLDRLADVLVEARRFLGLAQPTPIAPPRPEPPDELPNAARRLLVTSHPVVDTIAETYLRTRGVAVTPDLRALRFHPRCFYRITDAVTGANRYEVWPVLLAIVTDVAGKVTGVHRTWLDPSGHDKAPVSPQRRALGQLLGHGVRFGAADDIMAAGEGLETVLSVRTILPAMPMAAALSANHLAAFRLPSGLQRLYVVRDNDPAGQRAAQELSLLAQDAGIEARPLTPSLKDFNDDLRHLGTDALRAALRQQLAPEDMGRFMESTTGTIR